MADLRRTKPYVGFLRLEKGPLNRLSPHPERKLKGSVRPYVMGSVRPRDAGANFVLKKERGRKMKAHRYSTTIWGLLFVALTAAPASAQTEEEGEAAPEEVAVQPVAPPAAEAESEPTSATPKRNQVFFRGAYSRLKDDRGGEVFTDTGAADGANDDKGGFSIAAGLNLALTDPKLMGGLVLLGEIFVEYSQFSKKQVLQTTSALLGGTNTSDVKVSALNVTVAPMFRYDYWNVVRPFFIPIGLSFLVNGPPSNDTTYLDLGLHFSAGFDFVLIDEISVGVDFRYTYAFDQPNTTNSYLSVGGYAAVNF